MVGNDRNLTVYNLSTVDMIVIVQFTVPMLGKVSNEYLHCIPFQACTGIKNDWPLKLNLKWPVEEDFAYKFI